MVFQMSRKEPIDKRLKELASEINNLVNAVAVGNASLALKGGNQTEGGGERTPGAREQDDKHRTRRKTGVSQRPRQDN